MLRYGRDLGLKLSSRPCPTSRCCAPWHLGFGSQQDNATTREAKAKQVSPRRVGNAPKKKLKRARDPARHANLLAKRQDAKVAKQAARHLQMPSEQEGGAWPAAASPSYTRPTRACDRHGVPDSV